MPRLRIPLNVLLTVLVASCAGSDPAPPQRAAAGSPSVWMVDLVRTLPGRQDEYVRSIEANWAAARRLATVRGAVLSYRALVAPPDSARGWDIALMTEFADSAAWADREAIFQAIFASPDFVPVPSASPSSELRAFAVSGLAMREVAGAPPR